MQRSDQMSSAGTTALAWRDGLPRERHLRTDLRGGLLFFQSGAIYVLLFLGAFVLPDLWTRLACLFALPLVIGALFVIGHDAAHHSLMRSRWLNEIIGRLSMLPAYHPFTSWCYAHNALHHGGTCLKSRHPDFPPLSKTEFDGLPYWRRGLERIYRSPLGVGLAYTFDFFGRYLLFPRGRNRSPHGGRFQLDRLLVLFFALFQFWAGLTLSAHVPHLPLPRWQYAAIVQVVPWLLWIYFMGVASFVQHTHPRTAWYDDEREWSFFPVQLRSSTHVLLPWPFGRILHNIMDHPAHHLDPAIPLYELPASQRELERQAPEHSVVVRLTLTEYLRICRVCKLYDYRRHCWLDFDGRPTAGADLHEPANSGKV